MSCRSSAGGHSPTTGPNLQAAIGSNGGRGPDLCGAQVRYGPALMFSSRPARTRLLCIALLIGCCAAACSNPGMVPHHEEDLPRNWEGQHIDRLIRNWGPPSTEFKLPDGGTSYMFEHATYLEGEEMYCFAIFVANANGIIRSSSVGGSIPGCNWILATGKRSPRKGVDRDRRPIPR